MRLQNFSLNHKKNPDPVGVLSNAIEISLTLVVCLLNFDCVQFSWSLWKWQWKRDRFTVRLKCDIEWQQPERTQEGVQQNQLNWARVLQSIRIESIRYLTVVLHKFIAINWIYRANRVGFLKANDHNLNFDELNHITAWRFCVFAKYSFFVCLCWCVLSRWIFRALVFPSYMAHKLAQQ